MTFDVDAHRRQRLRDLERRVQVLEGERQRLEAILATTLRILCCRQAIEPLEALELIALSEGFDLGRAHIFDNRSTA